MSPLQYYQSQLKKRAIHEDSAQHKIVVLMDALYHQLKAQHSCCASIKRDIQKLLALKQKPVRGLYLWGGVGRGKTYLMDILYNLYPYEDKARMHFHRFMQYVHHALNQHQGKKNPLKAVAKEFSKSVKLLCFDEFFVSDIADAMCLGNLLQHLMDYGVTLVATSNIYPDELYKNGLQREKFLPAIAALKRFTNVVELGGDKDWRLQQLATLKLYHYPLNTQAEAALQQSFAMFSSDGEKDKTISVIGREIKCRYVSNNIIWFDSTILLESARSALDYLEIARSFHTVLISNVTRMNEHKEDVARRFISLVDIFYERHVTLIISAEVDWPQLYQGRRHQFEFERTLSRLTHMQTQEYLALPHLP
jgi:cell division protein ZapE